MRFANFRLCRLIFTCMSGCMVIASAGAQNFVPNGDFEDFIFCPDDMSQIDALETWFAPSIGTPDYFNTCDTTDMASIPNNFMGAQEAQSGNGYAGVFVAQNDGPLYREYLEVQLNEPLIAGKPYLLDMYVSLADESSCWPNMVCAYLADQQITDYTTSGTINQPTHLVQTLCSDKESYISNTTGWQKINFCFTAIGTEKFLIIGNNYSDAYAGCYGVNNTGYYAGYIYIDQVSLTNPAAHTIYFDTSFCKGNEVTVDLATLIDQPDNSTPAYTWNDGSHEQVRSLTGEGLYEVLVQNDCAVDTVYITVDHAENCPEIFMIPNAFSPNGDGVNDRFRIREENITVERFEIYNRWGALVFASDDAATGWDGTTKGSEQPIGVYLYILDYTTNITEQAERKTGYVTLIR